MKRGIPAETSSSKCTGSPALCLPFTCRCKTPSHDVCPFHNSMPLWTHVLLAICQWISFLQRIATQPVYFLACACSFRLPSLSFNTLFFLGWIAFFLLTSGLSKSIITTGNMTTSSVLPGFCRSCYLRREDQTLLHSPGLQQRYWIDEMKMLVDSSSANSNSTLTAYCALRRGKKNPLSTCTHAAFLKLPSLANTNTRQHQKWLVN